MKRIHLWIVGIFSLAVMSGGAYYYQSIGSAAAEEAPADQQIQTAVVRQGELVVSATGAGTTIPFQEINLGFETAGTLTALNVRVGDTVTAGDVLAQVDETAAQEGLINARLALSKMMLQTDADTTSAGTSYNDISTAQARLTLDQAQKAVDDLLNWEPDGDEIAVAEANLNAAEASLTSAQGQQSSTFYNVEIAGINLEQARQDVADAQETYDNVFDSARDWEVFYNEPICDPGEQEPCTGQTWAERIERDRESAATALERAQENLVIAEIQYNQQAAGSAGSSVASAQTSLLSAQLNLETALSEPTEEEISAAKDALHQAELTYQQAMLNSESSLIDLQQAQLNVAAAQAAIEGTTLTAPIDGTIMAITAAIGENVGTSPVMSIADLQEPLLEIFLDESDLNMVGLDFEVEVTFDALPDETFIGRIIQVDPALTEQSGLNVVRAIVQLDDFAKPQTLPIGLNATVEVIGGRAQNALLVPVEALRELTPGNFSVFVMSGGELELRAVEIGLMDFTFVEITAGLEAGDTVTTGIVETGG